MEEEFYVVYFVGEGSNETVVAIFKDVLNAYDWVNSQERPYDYEVWDWGWDD